MAANEQEAIELLRAVAHARMFVTSGRGIESIVHQLANGGLGSVSKLLYPALDLMDQGEPAELAVKSIMDRQEDPYTRAFLAAIISSGKPAVMRLDELSEALHTERAAKAEIYGARLTGIVDMTATLFVFSFAPTILKVLELIPENPVLPTVTLPWWLDEVFYTFMAGVLTLLLLSARSR
jgi:hypothetical protein